MANKRQASKTNKKRRSAIAVDNKKSSSRVLFPRFSVTIGSSGNSGKIQRRGDATTVNSSASAPNFCPGILNTGPQAPLPRPAPAIPKKPSTWSLASALGASIKESSGIPGLKKKKSRWALFTKDRKEGDQLSLCTDEENLEMPFSPKAAKTLGLQYDDYVDTAEVGRETVGMSHYEQYEKVEGLVDIHQEHFDLGNGRHNHPDQDRRPMQVVTKPNKPGFLSRLRLSRKNSLDKIAGNAYPRAVAPTLGKSKIADGISKAKTKRARTRSKRRKSAKPLEEMTPITERSNSVASSVTSSDNESALDAVYEKYGDDHFEDESLLSFSDALAVTAPAREDSNALASPYDDQLDHKSDIAAASGEGSSEALVGSALDQNLSLDYQIAAIDLEAGPNDESWPEGLYMPPIATSPKNYILESVARNDGPSTITPEETEQLKAMVARMGQYTTDIEIGKHLHSNPTTPEYDSDEEPLFGEAVAMPIRSFPRSELRIVDIPPRKNGASTKIGDEVKDEAEEHQLNAKDSAEYYHGVLRPKKSALPREESRQLTQTWANTYDPTEQQRPNSVRFDDDVSADREIAPAPVPKDRVAAKIPVKNPARSAHGEDIGGGYCN